MEDFGVLWATHWGGDSVGILMGFFGGYGMGMGNEIKFQRHAW